MKKSLFVGTLVLFSLLSTSNAIYAEDNQTENKFQKTPIEREMPKLYDKEGNELKAPPKPGEAVYDKEGNEIKMRHGFGRHHDMPKGPDLNLTDKQKAQADKIREASKTKIQPLIKEMHSIEFEIGRTIRDRSITSTDKQEKIKPLIEKADTTRAEIDKIIKNDMQQFEKILTKDQKKTLEEFKATHNNQKFKGQSGFRGSHRGYHKHFNENRTQSSDKDSN